MCRQSQWRGNNWPGTDQPQQIYYCPSVAVENKRKGSTKISPGFQCLNELLMYVLLFAAFDYYSLSMVFLSYSMFLILSCAVKSSEWVDRYQLKFLGSVQVPFHKGNDVLCAAMQKVQCPCCAHLCVNVKHLTTVVEQQCRKINTTNTTLE